MFSQSLEERAEVVSELMSKSVVLRASIETHGQTSRTTVNLYTLTSRDPNKLWCARYYYSNPAHYSSVKGFEIDFIADQQSQYKETMHKIFLVWMGRGASRALWTNDSQVVVIKETDDGQGFEQGKSFTPQMLVHYARMQGRLYEYMDGQEIEKRQFARDAYLRLGGLLEEATHKWAKALNTFVNYAG